MLYSEVVVVESVSKRGIVVRGSRGYGKLNCEQFYQYMWKYPNQDIFPEQFMYADSRIAVRIVVA